LFDLLFRFHVTGSGLLPSMLKVTVGLDALGAGLAGRVLLEEGDETAVHLFAGFCVRCVKGTSESVSSADTFSEESDPTTVLVCFFNREADGREVFVRNFVSVCCLAMVEFKVEIYSHHYAKPT
jgi:hypothetical protein